MEYQKDDRIRVTGTILNADPHLGVITFFPDGNKWLVLLDYGCTGIESLEADYPVRVGDVWAIFHEEYFVYQGNQGTVIISADDAAGTAVSEKFLKSHDARLVRRRGA